VDGSVEPGARPRVIEFELALADLGVVEKRSTRPSAPRRRATRRRPPSAALEKAFAPLSRGKALWHVALTEDERKLLKGCSCSR
jgi:hypothetical protein